jgi:hypothetical protein
VVDRALLAEIGIGAARRGARRLAGRRESLADLVDEHLLAELESAIDAGIALGGRGREFVVALMEREFIRGLFTDIIYTALVSFQSKANPLFGAFAMRALEDQIKSFIGFFMPMLQAQAAAFVVDRGNQRAVLDFARAVARQLLSMPIGRYAESAAGEGGRAAAALLRHAAADERLAELARRTALLAWDDLFAEVKSRRLGALFRIEEHADWLAERAVRTLVPLLTRPGILSLIADEIAAAPQPAPAPAPRAKRRR